MLSKEAVERIKTKVFPQIDQLDLILVCDFGNGFFHYELVDEIKKAQGYDKRLSGGQYDGSMGQTPKID